MRIYISAAMQALVVTGCANWGISGHMDQLTELAAQVSKAWQKDRRASTGMAAVDLVEAVARLLVSRCEQTDLTQPQWAALRFFGNTAHNATIGDFAQFFRISPSSASQTVARLRSKDLVSYNRPESDRRRCEVMLTDAGRDALADDPARWLAGNMMDMPPSQFESLIVGLTGLVTKLDTSNEPEPGHS